MGYPIEIPNSIPRLPPPPRRSRLERLLERVFELLPERLQALLRPRRRQRADAPQSFGQGVDAKRPPISARERAALDIDQLAEEFVRRS